MVLVYGAAGRLGGEICRRLRRHGKGVRAMMPRNAPATALRTLREIGAELIIADLCEIPAIAAACSGQESIICADPALTCDNVPPLGVEGVRCLAEFSRMLGVREFVFVTVPERFSTRCALVEARREFCDRMDSHRLNYVMIETGFLMETWMRPDLALDYVEGKATVFGSGTEPVGWVARGDVAEVAARSVGADHHRRRHIRVSAENRSQNEVVRIFEDQRNGPITVARIAEAELRAGHQRATDPSDRVLSAMKVELAQGLPMRADDEEIPFPLATVAEYARTALAGSPDPLQVRNAGR